MLKKILMLILKEKNKKNIGLIKIRKIIKDLDSGKIYSVDSLKGRYFKDISSDKEYLDKKIVLVIVRVKI